MVDDSVNESELQDEILRILKEGGINYDLGRGFEGVVEWILKKHPLQTERPKTCVAEALWSLVAKGLVFIDFTFPEGLDYFNHSSVAEHWKVMLTDRGRAAAGDTTINPDKPRGYLEEFVHGIARPVPDTVQMYVKEALKTYTDRSYLACAVMLGVAAEAAFFELLQSFCQWLPSDKGTTLRKELGKRGTPYSALHEEFRRQFENNKKDVPAELQADLDLRMNAVLGLIREFRNDSGHPTGKSMDRATCHVALVQFAYAMPRLFALKDFFESRPHA